MTHWLAIAAGIGGWIAAGALALTDADPAPALAGAPERPVQMAQLLDPTREVPRTSEQGRLSFAPIVREAAPAVVNVYSSRVVRERVFGSSMFDMLFGDGFGMPRERVQSSLGSGVIVSPDGVIVTNTHVIEGADELTVVLNDRREFPAEIILADERTDLAVLKIDAGVLPTLDIADTRSLEVGDLVLAIGNPFGVGQTVTSGIVSALARTDVGVTDYAFFIQTDAAINPGNSGGALVDADGRLVGVNTAIFSRSGGSNGIGFAIPAEMVRRVIDAAVNDGQVVRPWLGVKGQPVTTDMTAALGLEAPRGVIVSELYPGAPGEKAGLRRGDVILTINGREVFDEGGLRFVAATLRPGERTDLTILRDGRPQTVRATLSPPPGATEADLVVLEGAHPFDGSEVAELSPALADALRRDPFETGVVVNRLFRGSLAVRFGLRPGDVIAAVNSRSVDSVEDLQQAIAAGGPVWVVDVRRNGRGVRLQARL